MPLAWAVLSVLLFAVLWPVALLHPRLTHGRDRRFGRYPPDFLASRTGPRLWLHGASSADLLALLPIYRELRRRRPDLTIVVSALTNNGEAVARTRFADADACTFLPWDLPWVARRAVDAIRPDVLVLEYTELWPALMHAAKARGARIVLTNGHLGPRNLGPYRVLFALAGNLVRLVDRLLMRSRVDKERALSLGAPPDRVVVTGNSTLDTLLGPPDAAANDALARDLGLAPDGRLFVAGHVHEGEEELFVNVCASLRAAHPDLRFVLAPRPLERASRLLSIAKTAGIPSVLRSQSGVGRAALVVLDRPGELTTAYRLATLAAVGGSFADHGGQNVLEPAACGRPVLFGPHMENFGDAAQLLVGRGGLQVNDEAHLTRVASDLLARPDQLQELGALALSAVETVRGASERDAAEILALLDAGPGARS